ncbi:hypothetical protein CHS0354_003519, partial [Potamilus streckersoni]
PILALTLKPKCNGSDSLAGVIIRSLVNWDFNAPKVIPKKKKALPEVTKTKNGNGAKTRSQHQEKKRKESNGAKTKILSQKNKSP